LGRKHAKECNP
jgi:hypothetical protein